MEGSELGGMSRGQTRGMATGSEKSGQTPGN